MGPFWWLIEKSGYPIVSNLYICRLASWKLKLYKERVLIHRFLKKIHTEDWRIMKEGWRKEKPLTIKKEMASRNNEMKVVCTFEL